MLNSGSSAEGTAPGWRRHAPSLAILSCVLIAHALVNAWWLSQDNLPRMGDDAQHAIFALSMYNIATEEAWSVQGRVKALAQVSTGIYPPLFHYMAMAGGLVFGPSRAGFAAINTPILWALAFAVYALAAHSLRPRYALLAAVTCSAVPLIAGPSRLCVTDLLTAFWCAAALIALMQSNGFNRRFPALCFGVLLGLGLLTRWMVPVYLAVPAMVAVAAGWRQVRAPWLTPERKRLATRRWLATLGIAAAAAVVLAAPWYASRAPQMLGVYQDYFRPMDGPSPFHAGSAEGGVPVSAQPAPEPPAVLQDFGAFELRTWISYALLLNNKGLFLPVSVLTLAGMLIAAACPRRNRLGFLLVALAGAYIALTLFWAIRAPATRYLIPLIPLAAVFCALALQSIPSRRWRKGSVAVFCGWLLFQFVHFSIAPVSGIERVDAPFFREHPIVHGPDDHGLVVWASHVNAGGARIGPPYRGFNWIDHAFDAMRAHEVSLLPGNRHQANVMLAGALKPALESVQHEHWPHENPLDPASPRVREVVNPYAPIVLPLPGPRWLDAVSVKGMTNAVEAVYRDAHGEWQPLTTVPVHDGHGFQSFPRVRADALRWDESGTGGAQFTAWRHEPQPRPFILIEQANRPRDWPVDRIAVADYLVVVSPEGREDFYNPPGDFHAIDKFNAKLHGYWDERHIAVFARRLARPIALDTLPGLRVEVIEAGGTHEGRWDMPWWRLGRLNAPGLAGLPEAWEAAGPVTVEVSFPKAMALARIEAEVTTEGTRAEWAFRANGEWTPLAPGVAPPDPVDALRLVLTPSRPGGIVGLQQVFIEPPLEDTP